MSKLWRRSVGERSCRVILFERTPGGPLYREVYVGGQRVASKKSLRHKDQERAKADAHTLLGKLLAHEEALDGGRLTLQTLFDNYVGSAVFRAKKPRTQQEDRSRLKRLLGFLGSEREVKSLAESDVAEYNHARTHGLVTPNRVRARAVEADCSTLRAMLNWATRQRVRGGKPMLDHNPLHGVSLPREKNPRRPIATWERFQALREAAHKLRDAEETDGGRRRWLLLEMALVIVESTGRRIGSVRQLRWGDIDFERRRITWRSEHDKQGREWVVPMTEGLADELRFFRRAVGALEGWLFAIPPDSNSPLDRSWFDNRLRGAEKEAGLAPLDGSLWHAYRRKWATERKHLPVTDVAAAGGWKDHNTLLTCYQQPDPETLLAVVSEPRKVREAGLG